MAKSKWSDDQFLDGLRQQGDPQAEECVSRLSPENDFHHLFATMNSNDSPLPDDMPAPMRTFFDAAGGLPTLAGTEVDQARLRCGEKAFLTHAFPAALVLLTASLPQGYAAPNLAKILAATGNLEKYPYRRLMGVLQLVVNVSTLGGFEHGGKAVVSAHKMRLLHAGIRHVVRMQLPDYEAEHGVPVNLEDMLGTIMGFSLLVVNGLKRLGVGLHDEEAEDFYYLWRVFAQTAGIHPRNQRNSTDYVPTNVAEANEFYDAFVRRHVTDVANNPWGRTLSQSNIDMMIDLLPAHLNKLPLIKVVPRVYMQILNGRKFMRMIGINPVHGFVLWRWFLRYLPKLWVMLWQLEDRILDPDQHVHAGFSKFFFQHLIDDTYDGEVTFIIPDSLATLRNIDRDVKSRPSE